MREEGTHDAGTGSPGRVAIPHGSCVPAPGDRLRGAVPHRRARGRRGAARGGHVHSCRGRRARARTRRARARVHAVSHRLDLEAVHRVARALVPAARRVADRVAEPHGGPALRVAASRCPGRPRRGCSRIRTPATGPPATPSRPARAARSLRAGDARAGARAARPRGDGVRGAAGPGARSRPGG